MESLGASTTQQAVAKRDVAPVDGEKQWFATESEVTESASASSVMLTSSISSSEESEDDDDTQWPDAALKAEERQNAAVVLQAQARRLNSQLEGQKEDEGESEERGGEEGKAESNSGNTDDGCDVNDREEQKDITTLTDEELEALVDAELAAAAIKIQARARGMSERSQVANRKAKAKEEEEMARKEQEKPEEKAKEEKEENAKQGETQEADRRQEQDATSKEKEQEAQMWRTPSFKQKAPAALSGGAMKELDDHATAIQARARGMLARKQANVEGEKATISQEKDDEPTENEAIAKDEAGEASGGAEGSSQEWPGRKPEEAGAAAPAGKEEAEKETEERPEGSAKEEEQAAQLWRTPSFKQKAPAALTGGALKDVDEHARAIQAGARGMLVRDRKSVV